MGARSCRLLLQPNIRVLRQDIFLDLDLDIEKMTEEKKKMSWRSYTVFGPVWKHPVFKKLIYVN
jgi:hypothetical protein